MHRSQVKAGEQASRADVLKPQRASMCTACGVCGQRVDETQGEAGDGTGESHGVRHKTVCAALDKALVHRAAFSEPDARSKRTAKRNVPQNRRVQDAGTQQGMGTRALNRAAPCGIGCEGNTRTTTSTRSGAASTVASVTAQSQHSHSHSTVIAQSQHIHGQGLHATLRLFRQRRCSFPSSRHASRCGHRESTRDGHGHMDPRGISSGAWSRGRTATPSPDQAMKTAPRGLGGV